MPNATDADTLNPEALKAYRKSKGYHSQAQLAEALGCRTDQVNRWETGKTKKPRPHLLNKLMETLGVAWEDLTRPPKVPDNEESRNLSTTQLNVRVPHSTRTALELVSAIYGVSWADIIELSPLLFFISAQKSLEARKEALGDAFERIENITGAPHLAEAFSVFPDERAIQREEASIENREVFAYGGSGAKGLSPYANYLKGSINDLPEKERSWISEIESAYSVVPDYRFASELLREVSGISEELEGSDDLLLSIERGDGDADLKELRRKRKSMPTEEFEEYLRELIAEEKQLWADIEF